MIELIPAIDIINGECVRLTKGDYNQKTVYGSPVDVATSLEKVGFKRLHVVDLDGAKSKHIVNSEVLMAIAEATSLTIDFGGGLKKQSDIETAFDCGASMVTVGSVSYTHPETFEDWIRRYGADKLILGADVHNGKIAINGWLTHTEASLFDFLSHYVSRGIKNILCTDISKDGTMQGASIDLYKDIMKAFPGVNLIASGGVASTKDILALEEAGIPSVVFGKAYYEGRIDIESIKRFL